MSSNIVERPEAVEPETLEQLLHSALGPAYNFAVRLTRDEVEAEDLVQDAALRACRFFEQFQPGTNFRAWFFKILANCYYNQLRRNGRQGDRVSIEDAPPLHLYVRSNELGWADGDADPAGKFLERLGTDEIAEALNELPEDYRTVATLYFVDDFKYGEIADVLDIPIGTVRSRLHRGRRLLQASLWNLATEHGLVPSKERM